VTGLARETVERALDQADDRELIAELYSRGIRVEHMPNTERMVAGLERLRALGPEEQRTFRAIESVPSDERMPDEAVIEAIRLQREMLAAVEAIDAGLRGLMMPGILPDAATADTVWCFWCPDDDRSTGWTNHGYVLQLVCRGRGRTAREAWANAKAAGVVPEDFELGGGGIATREDHEKKVEFTS